MDESPIAIVRVGLESLEFSEGRQIDEFNVMSLVEIFENSDYGCDRNDAYNIIPAYIDPKDFNDILEMSDLTSSDLQRSLTSQDFRPRLQTGNKKILCLHGQHRIEAAKRFLSPGDFWWIIKLKIRPFEEVQRVSYEPWESDGEIYRKVRFYAQQDDMARECMLRLKSKSKQRNLSWLLERGDYTQSLDMLLVFPGLWVGFLLGNIRRLFALRCDTELQRYLKHMSEKWIVITLNSSQIQRSTNIETVQRLQGKAPLASISDRQSIIRDMNKGILFPDVKNARTRQLVLEAILGLDVIIPSFKTFHENSRLLEIGVHIIRRELTDSLDGSLFDSLCKIWSPPSTCSLETHEGVFRFILLPDSVNHAYLVYFLIFLAAFRQFPNLGLEAPQRDARNVPLHAHVDPNYKTLFARRARFLGLSNRQIEENCRLVNGELLLANWHRATRKSKTGLETRSGRPFEHAYIQLQEELFIMNLWKARLETTREPSAMFVQQDFLRAFFSPNIIFVDWTDGPRLGLIATNLMAEERSNLHTSRELHNSPTAMPWQDTSRSASPMQPIQERNIFHRRREAAISDSLPVASPTHFTPERNNFEVSRELTPAPSTLQVNRSATASLSIVSPIYPTERNNFDIPRESSTSATTTSISSLSAVIARSPSIIDTVRSSPRLRELTSHFMNTGIETIEQNVTEFVATQVVYEGAEPSREEQPNSTPTFGRTSDSWASDGSTSLAGVGSEEQGLTLANGNRSHRSYLSSRHLRHSEPQAGLRQSSFVKPRMTTRMRKERQAREGRTRHRSFLNPVARITKRRHRMRSFLVSNQNETSPKGKEILRDSVESPTARSDSSSEAQALSSRAIRPLRSYLKPRNSGQQRARRSHQTGSPSRAMLPQDQKTERTVRSYLKLDRQVNQSTEGKALALDSEISVDFQEYNGMTLRSRSTTNLTEHLKRRRKWVGMVIIDREPRSLRLDHIAKYMENKASENNPQTLVLVKQAYAERFRVNYSVDMR